MITGVPDLTSACDRGEPIVIRAGDRVAFLVFSKKYNFRVRKRVGSAGFNDRSTRVIAVNLSLFEFTCHRRYRAAATRRIFSVEGIHPLIGTCTVCSFVTDFRVSSQTLAISPRNRRAYVRECPCVTGMFGRRYRIAGIIGVTLFIRARAVSVVSRKYNIRGVFINLERVVHPDISSSTLAEAGRSRVDTRAMFTCIRARKCDLHMTHKARYVPPTSLAEGRQGYARSL